MLLSLLLLGLLAGVQSADVCKQVAEFPKGCETPMTLFCFNQQTKRCEGIKACPPSKYTNAFATKESCVSLCVDEGKDTGAVEEIEDEEAAQKGVEEPEEAEDDEDDNEDDDEPAAAKVIGRGYRWNGRCRNIYATAHRYCPGYYYKGTRCRKYFNIMRSCGWYHTYFPWKNRNFRARYWLRGPTYWGRGGRFWSRGFKGGRGHMGFRGGRGNGRGNGRGRGNRF